MTKKYDTNNPLFRKRDKIRGKEELTASKKNMKQ